MRSDWSIEYVKADDRWEITRGRRRVKAKPDLPAAILWLRGERHRMRDENPDLTEKDLGRVFLVEEDGYRTNITRQHRL